MHNVDTTWSIATVEKCTLVDNKKVRIKGISTTKEEVLKNGLNSQNRMNQISCSSKDELTMHRCNNKPS